MLHPDSDAQRARIIAALRQHADPATGNAPTMAQLCQRAGLRLRDIPRLFGDYHSAVAAAGLTLKRPNTELSAADILTAYGEALRSLRAIPTEASFKQATRRSLAPVLRHFGRWSAVPEAFRAFAADQPQWADALAILNAGDARLATYPRRSYAPAAQLYSPRTGASTYGAPLYFRALRHAPLSESGVIFLFGMLAEELGLLVDSIQPTFPDCEALRRTGAGRWQRVRIEFEYESRSFAVHGHDPAGCDLLVCWRHNWETCPDTLEVLELRSLVGLH